MASIQNIGIKGEKIKADNELSEKSTGMSKEISIVPLKPHYHSNSNDVAAGDALSEPKHAVDAKELQLQKDKEEKIRMFRGQQEEERLRKLRDLEQQFLQSKKHREQQEQERKRKIEEARIKELERRQQVEERKRQIWEAEQERKEAILRRNMEREARIEARRNAQRNSQCFAFGSSTPRTFDLDLAAIGVGRNSVLMSSVSRRSEERELGPPRATSACSIDRKFENFSYHDDLRKDYPDFFRSSSLEPRVSYISKQIAIHSKSSIDMKACLSMWDSNTSANSSFLNSSPFGCLVGSGVLVGEDCMSRSMISLSSSTFQGRKRTDITPTLSRERSITPHLTRQKGKDSSRSPSRPQSSMSGTSEISTTSSSISGVVMRARPAPRRPRPFTIAGPILDSSVKQSEKSEPERQARLHDRNVSEPVQKPLHRAKSASRENGEVKSSKPVAAPKKPVPPPKSTELLAKVKTLPVPAKDNLRKMPKSTATKSLSSGDNKPSTKEEKSYVIQSIADKELKTKETPPVLNMKKLATSNSIPAITNTEMPSPANDSKAVTADPPDVNGVSKTECEDNDIFELSNLTSDKVVESQTLVKETDDESITKPLVRDIPSSIQTNEGENSLQELSSKPRITSEEEAKAALAEKRRLAREQAEREAELERQRLEDIRRKEDEQRQLEEEEQRRMEEEQIRLAELHRKIEDEKLAKAIEEQNQREKEEQEKREEEARQKNEREEQERKAREEAEKQRIELEEKLRKEEEERAERKRRVEQIMARTRGRSAAQSPVTPTTPANINSPSKNTENLISGNGVEPSETNTSQSNQLEHVSNGVNSSLNGTTENDHISNSRRQQFNPLPDILNSTIHSNNLNGSGIDEQLLSKSSEFTLTANRTLSANDDVSPQTNGYSSHEEMSCTTSPEDSSDVNLLIDFQSNPQKSSKFLTASADYTRVDASIDVVNNENYLINVDDVNSNLFKPANPFVGFEESLQKKPDTVTDLLS